MKEKGSSIARATKAHLAALQLSASRSPTSTSQRSRKKKKTSHTKTHNPTPFRRQMSERGAHHPRGPRANFRGGRGGRGGGGGGSSAEKTSSTERPKKENILDLSKYMDKQILVKFNGGREGASRPLFHRLRRLDSFDALMNLVLDDVEETLRDEDGNESTRSLGLVVARGTLLVVIMPVDGSEQIANPFVHRSSKKANCSSEKSHAAGIVSAFAGGAKDRQSWMKTDSNDDDIDVQLCKTRTATIFYYESQQTLHESDNATRNVMLKMRDWHEETTKLPAV
ncbi:hypothetical protein L249_1851 [Ophiocordyceps polyrhachis-furcata BCC 54312]|uniref:Sm domain-containing protein n=1 Tax=Ophiocordyceps polyrhachis-furcata BCC 54312 TaxID=1330021 RepID=A0A367LPB9_9HYPO|nr:hypothetical protein L249_1851 [Ophiocordyceps polyrhachis-furcata BCC 54312]